MSQKEILREEIKKILKNTAKEDFRSQGNRAADLLRTSPVWNRYTAVFLFMSMNSEIDTQVLVETAFKEGKKVFIPKVEGEKLLFYPLLSPDGPWSRGPFGIREPAAFPAVPPYKTSEGKPALPEDFPALIITPGLAFDRQGNRLGRGRAYYDRFFAKLDEEGMRYTALGLCMNFQIVPRVPAGENDKKMDGLLTGTELFLVKGKK